MVRAKKRQRYSALVEVQMTELVGDATYRDTADFINTWTPVEMSHQTVKTILEKVGKIQGEYDQSLVEDLEESACLPDGKQLDFFYAEADGVFVRSTEKGKISKFIMRLLMKAGKRMVNVFH
jgi:Uncharacterised protein family (UPF0236).